MTRPGNKISDDAPLVYEIWLVEGHTCTNPTVGLYAVFATRKQAREWAAANQETHEHFTIRSGEVE